MVLIGLLDLSLSRWEACPLPVEEEPILSASFFQT